MDFPADYQAALDRAIYYAIPAAGQIRVSGLDRSSFIQRQTTNNINLVTAGKTQTTVLTSPTGRILDVLTLYPEASGDEGSLILLPLPGRTEKTLRFLRSRIFIMDKVTVSIPDVHLSHYLLDGPQAEEALEKAGFSSKLDRDDVCFATYENTPITILGKQGLTGNGYLLLVEETATAQLEKALNQTGAVQLSPATFNILRIEAGQPAADAELKEDYTPLETGLRDCVAENKGCYTGQEVLARQVTYDKITRGLIGVRLEEQAPPGSIVFADGANIGEITSCVLSPRFGSIGLAILKRPYNQPGKTILVGEKSQPVKAATCALPFSENS